MIETCFSNIRDYKGNSEQLSLFISIKYFLLDGGKKADRLKTAILYMIAKENLPLRFAESDGFRTVMNIAAPNYVTPSRTTVSSAMKNKYELFSTKLKATFGRISALSLTTDAWTEELNTTSFLGITAHFIEFCKLESVAFALVELDERHTGDYLGKQMLELCSEWNIETDKITAVLADNASNMKKAISDAFGKEKYVPCFAHCLDLIAKKPFTQIDSVKELLKDVSNIVRYFKHSNIAASELKKEQKNDSTQAPLRLIQSCPTRWNSTFYSIKRFLLLSEKIAPILIRNSTAPNMLTADRLEELKELVSLLGPIEELSKELSGQQYVTCSKSIPMKFCMLYTIQKYSAKTKIGEECKKMLIKEIKSRFAELESNPILSIATILDPRFKKHYFGDPVACQSAISNIETLLEKYTIRTDAEDTRGNNQEEVEEGSVWSVHNTVISASTSNRDVTSTELKNYLEEPATGLKTDPLLYWKNQTMYRNLSLLSEKFLCVVATSVPSERLFSKAGLIMTPTRNRLGGEMLAELIFLNNTKKSEWGLV